MPKIRLLHDFQGVETHNVFYAAGVHDVPDDVAERLVRDGRAEYVAEELHYGSTPEPALRQDDKKARRRQ